MEQYFYAGKTEKIIGHGLGKLGLDYSYLKAAVGLPHSDVKHLKAKNLSASQWIAICDALYLQVGSIRDGYNHREHKARIRFYWERGLLDLPRTRQIEEFIREIKQDKKVTRDFECSFQGNGLRFRIFYRSLGPNAFKVFRRKYNQALIKLVKIKNFAWVENFLILDERFLRELRLPERPKFKLNFRVFTSLGYPRVRV